MKKLFSLSAIAFSLMFVGAGCGAAPVAGTPSATAVATVGIQGVNSAFTQAGVVFTATDKTAAAQQALGADGAKLKNFTEYKFGDSNVIVLVGEAVDPNDAPSLGDTLSDSVKAEASATGLDYASVGGFNDAHWFGYALSNDAGYDVKVKALSAISQ